jgi:hypothetical protein
MLLVKRWWHGEPSVRPYPWIKQGGGGGVLGCVVVSESRVAWNGGRMRAGFCFLYGGDSMVQDFWDAG